jgi:hypothetical protein
MVQNKVTSFKKVSLKGGLGIYFVLAVAYNSVLKFCLCNTDMSARSEARQLKKQFPKSEILVLTSADLWRMDEL